MRELARPPRRPLAELVTEAQATGAIDPALDTEAVVRFCHAVGLGFLLFHAVELDLPDPEPWEQLITRLVDALDAASSPPTADTDHRPRRNPEMTTNEEILGRDDVNDLEAILAITNHGRRRDDPRREGQRRRHLHVGLREGRAPGAQQALREGQDAQWNGETDLPWDPDVDIEKVVANAPRDPDADPVLVAAQQPRRAARQLGRQGVGRARHRVAELDAEPVHARRAGRAASAPPRSSRRCRGSTPSTTPPPR